jgi:hypothetical protein
LCRIKAQEITLPKSTLFSKSASLLFFLFALSPSSFAQISLPPGASGIYTPSKMQQFVSSCPLWRTDATFQSTIRLTNMLAISNMNATVTLYFADGTPYALPPTRIPASGVAVINVNQVLTSAPAAIAAHISTSGSATVSYNYDWQGAIMATMSLLDTPRSLQYVYPFMFPHPHSMSGAMTLEGLWWKPTAASYLFVAMTNSTASPVNASVVLLDATGASKSTQQAQIPAKGTSMTRVDIPAGLSIGGVQVKYSGGMEDVLVASGIEDDTAGFSANLPMALPAMATVAQPQSFQFASVGIMNGQADTMMGFPIGTKFTPYAYFRNVSLSPTVVQPSVNWMNGSAPQSKTLPAVTLQPGQSAQVAIPPFPGVAPESLNFVYSFAGSLDGLLAATGSVDQTGNYVFAVEPHGVGQHSGVSSVYWAYGGGLDTMYTVWNPLSIGQQMQLMLIGDNGVLMYTIPIRLAPGASQTIDLHELVMSATPDSAARVMPRGSMQGSALLTGPKNDTTERLTVVMTGGIYNSKTATCGNTCETCNGFTALSASPDPASLAVYGTTQMTDEYTWYTGYQYNWTSNTQWSSSATGIATIQTTGQSSPGMASGVGAGSVVFDASFGLLSVNAGQICTQGTLPPCPTAYPVAQAPATVTPQVSVTSGPTTILAFASGASSPQSYFVSITASGTPSGGSFSWTTSSGKVTLTNATTATVTVWAVADQFSAAAGDVSVQVVYTLNSVPSSPGTTTLTVLKPVSLTQTSSSSNPTAHTCSSTSGTPTPCTLSLYTDTPNTTYTSYVRTIVYTVNGNLAGTTITLNMQLQESYTGNSNVNTGAGIGSGITDCFYYCSQRCRGGGPDSVPGTQTITANGFTVATKSVTWTCADATVT